MKELFESFFSLVLKTFSKSYIIPPLELTSDYFVLDYCMLDSSRFTNAEVNFIKVTSLCDRRLTAPNIAAQLNQCRQMCVNIHFVEKTL